MPSVPKKKPQPLPFSPLPVGKKIAALRKAKGLSQEALGELIGLSQKQITDYERGKTHLTDEMLIRFALVLGSSTDSLLGLKDIDTPGDAVSLRFARRMREIEQLPESKKKLVLQLLDDLIKANA
jgi:transcriptional regulator with XRE-family HTH domain